MAQAVAYGSITIVDLMDVSEFSVQPTSNLPLSVLYDPDQNSYNPDWSTSRLMLEPLVYYGGDRVALGTTGLTIDWAIQEGTSGEASMTNNGTILPAYSSIGYSIVDSGKLKAEQNQFTSNASMLTYIVTATYNEPDSGQTLVSKGQITFSLVRNASAAKTCTITGESIFKYSASSGTPSGAASIILTGRVTNTSISEWQYWDGTYVTNNEKHWVTYPRVPSGNTLTVNHDDATFVNDQCLIRLTTADANVYDMHTITKLRDGAAGAATITAVLTNDDQSIPVSGGIADYSAATTRLVIYNGGVEDTANWTITLSSSTGVTYTSSRTVTDRDTITVTNMTTDSATITFTAKKSGTADVIKTFSVIKVESGADAPALVTHSVEPSVYALNKTVGDNESVTYTPSTVTFYGYTQTAGQEKQPYTCIFKIYENLTYEAYKASDPKPTGHTYASTGDESSYTYTPSNSASTILCIMFDKGGLTKELDIQQVVVTSDGQKGEDGQQGPQGDAAISVVFGNSSDTLSCTNANTLIANQPIIISFDAYEGTTKIPCTFTNISLLGVQPNAIGTDSTSSKYATATQTGQIYWSLPAGTLVPNPSGHLSIQFTVTTSKGQERTVYQNYSWARNTAAKDGVSSVMLQIYSPTGTNTLDEDTITYTDLQAFLTEGTTDVTTSATSIQWYKFINGQYTAISGATSAQYRVNVANVDSYASFRCTARYNNKDYNGYFSVFDKTDPIQIAVLSSVGTQLVNGIGEGALYVKVTRTGAGEIDRLLSERFLTANPSSATVDDYYYKLNKTAKTVTLMKYTSSGWAEVSTNPYTGSYRWSWRDREGNPITRYDNDTKTLPTEGKVIYIDGEMIDKKIIADVEVTI